jgi:hypothetical protein
MKVMFRHANINLPSLEAAGPNQPKECKGHRLAISKTKR